MSQSASTLTLCQIAAWQNPSLPLESSPDWVAELPSLQREAVWKPVQVELIWDSIFRGFPIGSLVISHRLEGQKSRSGKHASDRWPDSVERRHLLDGQQRCNAIALGHSDPFADDVAPKAATAILWLDLDPPTDFPAMGSSMRFPFRVTTSAHPWGYTAGDDPTRLNRFPAGEMRQSIANCGWKPLPNGSDYQRPSPTELSPHKAGAPIPLAWLMLDGQGLKGAELWQAIQKRCAANVQSVAGGPRLWARAASDFIGKPQNEWRLKDLEHALLRALRMEIVALDVPWETIRSEYSQERKLGRTDTLNISSIEHLFQRLNNAGTPISSDELKYSMIKAHWPGIERTINSIKRQPMKPSQLALLGARAALASAVPLPLDLPMSRSITWFRKVAESSDQTEVDQRKLIQTYFRLSDDGRDTIQEFGSESLPHIANVVEKVDNWLLYRDSENRGLPAVLRSSIAHGSPDIYLLLMIFGFRS